MAGEEKARKHQEDRITVHKGEFKIVKPGKHQKSTREILEERKRELLGLKEKLNINNLTRIITKHISELNRQQKVSFARNKSER